MRTASDWYPRKYSPFRAKRWPTRWTSRALVAKAMLPDRPPAADRLMARLQGQHEESPVQWRGGKEEIEWL